MNLADGVDAALCAAFESLAPQVNPHVESARSHVNAWVGDRSLVRRDAARTRFENADFGWFAAVTYPTANADDLCLVADWFAWFFLLDDQLDDGGIGSATSDTDTLLLELAGVLVGGDAGVTPIGRALADLWTRTAPHGSPAWRERFLAHVAEGCHGAAWEAANRAAGRVPDIDEYIGWRRHTGAIYVCMDLIDIVEHLDVPDYDSAEPALRAACDVVCWTNDLYSWPKETSLGEFHNLVSVVGHHERRTSDDAQWQVVARIATELDRFAASAGAVACAPLVAGMRSWMRGNLDWSRATLRYLDAARPAEYLEVI